MTVTTCILGVVSDIVLVALITGGFTLASGIVGVVLTHRYSRRQAEVQRLDERRREARALVAEFVHAGTQWAAANGVQVPTYFKGANDPAFWIERPDTDPERALREQLQTIERTAGELRLIVDDAALLDAIAEAFRLMSDTTAMAALLDDSRRTGGMTWPDGLMADAFAHYRAVGDAFRAVEARAAELLRGAL